MGIFTTYSRLLKCTLFFMGVVIQHPSDCVDFMCKNKMLRKVFFFATTGNYLGNRCPVL